MSSVFAFTASALSSGTPSGTSVSSILSAAGEVVTEGLSWVGEVATVMSSTPIILIFVVVSFVGLGVGLIKRMMRV